VIEATCEVGDSFDRERAELTVLEAVFLLQRDLL
jgi:hypothetical protein